MMKQIDRLGLMSLLVAFGALHLFVLGTRAEPAPSIPRRHPPHNGSMFGKRSMPYPLDGWQKINAGTSITGPEDPINFRFMTTSLTNLKEDKHLSREAIEKCINFRIKPGQIFTNILRLLCRHLISSKLSTRISDHNMDELYEI